MGRYITLSKHNTLKDLGSSIPKAQGWDTEIPQADSVTSPTITGVRDAWFHPTEILWVDDNIFPSPRHQSKAKIEDMGASLADSTASPAMSDTKDTQSGPMETPAADHTRVPLAELDNETQKDLSTTWVTSPAELENRVTPTARSGDKLTGPPTLSGHTVKERQCVSTLTAAMETLNLEAPSVAVGCQGATVEELAEEDWHKAA